MAVVWNGIANMVWGIPLVLLDPGNRGWVFTAVMAVARLGGAQMPKLISFGFSHGPPPDADLVLDVRGVSHDLSRPEASKMRTQITDALRDGKRVAVGCEKGQHRSVVLVNDCAKVLRIAPAHRDKIHKPSSSSAKASPALTRILERIRNYKGV